MGAIDPANLRVGITLPILGELGDRQVPDVAALARHVEQLGLDAVRFPDLLSGDGSPALEAVVCAATAAAVTDRVSIEFGVLVLALRSVVAIAAQLQALQHLSGGRVVLGVGTGGFPGTPIWAADGHPAVGRGPRTDAALAVLRGLIAGEPVRVEHEAGRRTVTLAPPAPPPPILIGGNSDAALSRAIEHGDGWAPSSIAPTELSERVGKLRHRAEGVGRSALSITVAGGAAPGQSSAAREARQRFVRKLVDGYGRSEDEAERIPVSGSPAQMAEQLAAYASAGAERVGVAVMAEDWMAGAELVAEAVRLLR